MLSACSLFVPNSSPLVVYFQERSAQLDAPTRSLSAEAAQRANAEPTAPVTVAGYTDSAGSPPADVSLSQERAEVVADALAADGISASRRSAPGAGRLAVIQVLRVSVWKLRLEAFEFLDRVRGDPGYVTPPWPHIFAAARASIGRVSNAPSR